MAGMPQDFYPSVRPETISSAEVLTGRLFPDDLNGVAAVDLGSGEGHWSAELARRGATVDAFDAVTPKGRVVDVQALNFEDPDWHLDQRYELGLCLEVAEHLTPTAGQRVVRELASYCESILFSAAIPFQPGFGHINCRWQSAWLADLLDAGPDLAASWAIRSDIWWDERVEPWYRQNVLVLSRGGVLAAEARRATDTPLDVAHPMIYEWAVEG